MYGSARGRRTPLHLGEYPRPKVPLSERDLRLELKRGLNVNGFVIIEGSQWLVSAAES